MATHARSAWLVLDVDDTLVDTRRTGLAKLRSVAAELGLPALADDAFAEHYGARSFDECVARWFPGADPERVAARYDRLAPDFPPSPLCDGARVVARARSAGLRVGVLTNGPGRKTTRKLAAAGIDVTDVEFVCHADNSPVRKPDPRAFTRLSALGVRLDRAWYVSDAAADCRAARAVGMRSIGVAHGGVAVEGAQPDLVLSRSDLLAAVVDVLADADTPSSTGDPRGVGFDAGFTLVDEHVTAPATVAWVLAARGTPVNPEAVDAAFERHRAVLADRGAWASPAAVTAMLGAFYGAVLTALGVSEVSAVAAEVVRRYTAPENWQALPGSDALLALAAERGLRTGVLSNWQPDLAVVLSRAGLLTALDTVVVSSVVGAAKPSPAAFAALADALDVPARELVFVGDDPVADAGGILRCGGRAVLVDRRADATERVTALAMALPCRPEPRASDAEEPRAATAR